MSPEDRREAIIVATTQLVLDVGPDVSTRQIADACGLAEGTLFRVFDSKRDILTAVVEHITDPSEMIAEIAAMPTGRPLPDVLADYVTVIASAIARISSVMAALHSEFGRERPHGPPPGADKSRFLEDQARLTAAMSELLASHADALRVDPYTSAAFIQTVVFASGFPALGEKISDRAVLTDLLVHALVKEPPCSTTH